jgi:hypothetical protein
MTTCKTCKHWRSSPMNAHGFGACAHGKSYEYLPSQHSCKQFVTEDAKKLTKRLAWLKAKGVE